MAGIPDNKCHLYKIWPLMTPSDLDIDLSVSEECECYWRTFCASLAFHHHVNQAVQFSVSSWQERLPSAVRSSTSVQNWKESRLWQLMSLLSVWAGNWLGGFHLNDLGPLYPGTPGARAQWLTSTPPVPWRQLMSRRTKRHGPANNNHAYV